MQIFFVKISIIKSSKRWSLQLLIFNMLGQNNRFLSTRRRYRVNFTRVGHARVQSTPSCLVISGHQNWLKRTNWPIRCGKSSSLTTFPAWLSHVVHDGVALDFKLIELEPGDLGLYLPLEFHIFLHRFHRTSVWVANVQRPLHSARVTRFVIQSLGLKRYFA